MLESTNELSELLSIGMLNNEEARKLYEEGCVTLRLLAHANPFTIWRIMQSFSGKWSYEEMHAFKIEDAMALIKKASCVYMQNKRAERGMQKRKMAKSVCK